MTTRKRPPGRSTPTQSGADEAIHAPKGNNARRDEQAGTPSDAQLDEREQKQSTRRKPAGPKRSRLTAADVVVENPRGRSADAEPTDPK